jgi:hypothetical protein
MQVLREGPRAIARVTKSFELSVTWGRLKVIPVTSRSEIRTRPEVRGFVMVLTDWIELRRSAN